MDSPENLVVGESDVLRNFYSRVNRVDEDEPIFKQTLPTNSSCYIERTLITRRVIQKKVFSSTPRDVFVMHGIDRYGLSQLAGRELTDTSTYQVRKHKLSVRYILLQHFGDWDLLCTKTTNPIHLMRHHKGRFYWICTKGDISVMQKASDRIKQDELSEEQFIEEIENDLQFQPNQPICISYLQGMANSLLLASIASKLQQKCPQRFIAYINISEFIVKIRALLPEFKNTKKAMVEALLQILCENNSAREQLVQKIKPQKNNPSTQVELMFDGFDEVSTENLQLAQECSEIFKTSFNSTVRVWVTTRPQQLYRLEKHFSVLGHKIQTFEEKHQTELGKKLNKHKLETFSRQCICILKKKLKKKGENIAGIPLQCMMVA